jgi:hypothetical protein
MLYNIIQTGIPLNLGILLTTFNVLTLVGSTGDLKTTENESCPQNGWHVCTIITMQHGRKVFHSDLDLGL